MPGYVELHCHSYFSLLDGASSPEQLVGRAAALGMDVLALTDYDAVYGAIRFDRAAQAVGIRPIFGCELTLADDSHLTLLVENETGWQNLCWLISRARHNAPKGNALLPDGALDGHTAGLIALSGCRRGQIAQALRRGNWRAAYSAAGQLCDLFGPERLWIEMQHHFLPDDERLIYKLSVLADRIGLSCVATNNVHYAERHSHRLQDVLSCIRYGKTLDTIGNLARPNSEYYLKSDARMRALFCAYPDAIDNTRRIADRCQFRPRYGLQDLPTFPTPHGQPPEEYLRELCLAALPERLGEPSAEALGLLDHELALIGRHGLANYFL